MSQTRGTEICGGLKGAAGSDVATYSLMSPEDVHTLGFAPTHPGDSCPALRTPEQGANQSPWIGEGVGIQSCGLSP